MSEHESKDTHFMHLALTEAKKAFSKSEVPIGAIVVRNDTVISRGHNMRETWHDPTAHAEMIAIKQASRHLLTWRLTGCTMYVTIEPCLMCAGSLILARFSRLVYGASDPKAGAVKSLYQTLSDERLNHRLDVCEGVLENECRDLMRSFFRRLRQ